jgi:hypothetical protein
MRRTAQQGRSALRLTIGICVVGLCAVGLATSALAAEDVKPSPSSAAAGAEQVLISGPDALAQLQAHVRGRGIEGVELAPMLLPDGGEVIWKPNRETTDDLGMRHIFYRQYYLPPPALAQRLDEEYATEGIEISGSELGLHWKGKNLRSASGSQHKSVRIIGSPVLAQADDATVAALSERRLWPATRGVPSDALSGSVVGTANDPALALEQLGDDGLSFGWQVPSVDEQGVAIIASVDASTGHVLRTQEVLNLSNTVEDYCIPEPKNQQPMDQNAIAAAENGAPINGVRASDNGDKVPVWLSQQGFSWMARRLRDLFSPPILVGMSTDVPAMQCNGNAWSITPVDSVGQPNNGSTLLFYSNETLQRDFPGADAAQAMLNGYLTMKTFSSYGFDGFDGKGGPAALFVRTPYGQTDICQGGQFGRGGFPPDSVAFDKGCYLQGRFSGSMALDLVAHEWAHGLVKSLLGTDAVGPAQNSLNEGYADVIGRIVEWKRQGDPQPAGVNDWHTFTSFYLTPYLTPPEPGCAGLTYMRSAQELPPECATYKWCFHVNEEGCTPTAAAPRSTHSIGNLLPVAFRLLAADGALENPICDSVQNPNGFDCGTLVNGVGMEKASAILFHMITNYVTRQTAWAELPNLAKQAAFDLYADCSGWTPVNATAEQDAVESAFNAVGLPSGTTRWTCQQPTTTAVRMAPHETTISVVPATGKPQLAWKLREVNGNSLPAWFELQGFNPSSHTWQTGLTIIPPAQNAPYPQEVSYGPESFPNTNGETCGRVAAVYPNKVGGWSRRYSEPLCIEPPVSCEVVRPPAGLQAMARGEAAGVTSVWLSWEYPYSPKPPYFTVYRKRDDESAFRTVATIDDPNATLWGDGDYDVSSQPPWRYQGIDPQHSYEYEVAPNGCLDKAATVSITPLQPPSGLSAQFFPPVPPSEPQTARVHLSWNASPSGGNVQYSVWRMAPTTKERPTIASCNRLTATLLTQTPSTQIDDPNSALDASTWRCYWVQTVRIGSPEKSAWVGPVLVGDSIPPVLQQGELSITSEMLVSDCSGMISPTSSVKVRAPVATDDVRLAKYVFVATEVGSSGHTHSWERTSWEEVFWLIFPSELGDVPHPPERGRAFRYQLQACDPSFNCTSLGQEVTERFSDSETKPHWLAGLVAATSITSNAATLTWSGALPAECGGQQVQGFTVRLRRQGALVATYTVSGGGGSGSYRLTGLTPGPEYSAEVQADGQTTQSTDGPSVSFWTAVSISGRVTNSAGIGVGGVLVGPGVGAPFQSPTDATGYYTLADVPGGYEFPISAQKNGCSFTPISRPISTKTGNVTGQDFVAACAGVLPGSFTLSGSAGCAGTAPRVRLTWTAASGASAYDVYRAGVLIKSNLTATTYDDDTGVGGTIYPYTVTANNDVGSTQSNAASIRAWANCGGPPAAFNLKVYAGCSGSPAQNRLSWGWPDGATAFDIYRNGAAVASNLTSTVQVDDAVTAGATYQYQVIAKNSVASTGSNTVSVVGSTTCALPSPSPVAHWKLDEASGTSAADSSGNGATGTLLNGATFAGGLTGNAVSLDGVDDIVRIANAPQLFMTGDMTVSAWIKIAAMPTSSAAVLTKGQTYGLHYQSDGSVLFQIWIDGVTQSNAGTKWGTVVNPLKVSAGQWYMLTGVKQGSTIYAYLNGSLVASAPIAFVPPITTALVRIGHAGYGGLHKGLADDVRVYDRALSQAQIAALARPAIADFAAAPAAILPGGSSTLSWLATGATSLRLDPGSIDVTGTTSRVVTPATTTTYTLTASGPAGNTTAQTTVIVGNPPGSFALTVGNWCSGSGPMLTVTWGASSGATGYDLSRDGVLLAPDLTTTAYYDSAVVPGATYTYLVTAKNAFGTTQAGPLPGHTWLNCGGPPGIVPLSGYAGCSGLAAQNRLTWVWPDGAISFDVIRDGQTIAVNVAPPVFIDSGVSSWATSQYQILAKNSVSSSISNTITLATSSDCTSAREPVGHWALDETTGTSAGDSSGNGATGSLVNGPTFVAGQLGNAVSFDGVDDRIKVVHAPQLFMTGDMTISAWVKLAALPTDSVGVVSKGGNYTLRYMPDGAVLFQIYLDGVTQASAGTKWGSVQQPVYLVPGQWYRLTGVKQGNTVSLWVDRTLVATAPISFVPPLARTAVTIGNSPGYGVCHKGLIDEVRIYDRAAPPGEM